MANVWRGITAEKDGATLAQCPGDWFTVTLPDGRKAESSRHLDGGDHLCFNGREFADAAAAAPRVEVVVDPGRKGNRPSTSSRSSGGRPLVPDDEGFDLDDPDNDVLT